MADKNSWYFLWFEHNAHFEQLQKLLNEYTTVLKWCGVSGV